MESTNGLTTALGYLKEVFTWGLERVGEGAQFIMSQPVLFIPIGIGLVGGAIYMVYNAVKH